MTTREFIERQLGNADGRERWCSSVFKDGDGNVYSYGYHYPLAFVVEGLYFVNTAGYSVTTAKHINWAHQATGYDAIPIELPARGHWSGKISYTPGELVGILKGQLEDVQAQMAAKRRKDTGVYRNLEDKQHQIRHNIARIVQGVA